LAAVLTDDPTKKRARKSSKGTRAARRASGFPAEI